MIEHKDVPEHRGCNPGTNHPMVMYCEAQLNKLIAERCDCSEAEGYLCPTHAALYNKWAEFENMKLQNQALQNEVALLRRGRTCEECESTATGTDGYVCFPCWNKTNRLNGEMRETLVWIRRNHSSPCGPHDGPCPVCIAIDKVLTPEVKRKCPTCHTATDPNLMNCAGSGGCYCGCHVRG